MTQDNTEQTGKQGKILRNCPDLPPHVAFLASLDLSGLRAHARGLLVEITSQRTRISALRNHWKETAEEVESHRCRLMMSETYQAGKNAEIRSAWLAAQRKEDHQYWLAITAMEHNEVDLEAAKARLDSLEREFGLDMAEIRLAAAQLQFMAGE